MSRLVAKNETHCNGSMFVVSFRSITIMLLCQCLIQLSTAVHGEEGVKEATWWKPTPDSGFRWQWQLVDLENLNTDLDVDMYDVDLFDVTTEQIQALHDNGKIVVCYFSAGTYEQYRDDWSTYFDFITADVFYDGDEAPFANTMEQWGDERWLDIRRIDLLSDIMISRLQYAKNKNCDAVEPDNMDAYDNTDEVGLPDLTASDQLRYNRFIASEAHKVGLSVGLKNDVSQLQDLVDDYDWALNEECFEHNECDLYSAFTDKNKAVFGVEYRGNICSICNNANEMELSWLKKRMDLDSWRRGCTDMRTRLQCAVWWWLF
jgi:Glycoside-hydrolase family GH114